MTGVTIIAPTTISAGAYGGPGIAATRGAKNSDIANRPATPTAVKPVRPPAWTPAADSMYAPEVVVPTRPANIVAIASASIGRSICGNVPSASRNPARVETPISEPIVSINAITNMVSSTPKNPTLNAPRRSSFSMMGAGFVGMLSHDDGGFATPAANAIAAEIKIPSRIAPGARRTISTAISTKLSTATSTNGAARFPNLTGAPATPIATIPDSLSPMKLRNSPIPTPKL